MNLSSYDLATMNYYCLAYGFRINSFVVDTKHAFFDVIAYSITHNFKRAISDNNTNQLIHSVCFKWIYAYETPLYCIVTLHSIGSRFAYH